MPDEEFESIKKRDLQPLVQYPQEELGREYKPWLDLTDEKDKANIAQACLALANHGGGHLVLGFAEASANQLRAAERRPEDLGQYNQDIVNGIVERYADPSFHSEVHLVPHPDTGEFFPIILVPGGHTVPIRSTRDGPNGEHVSKDTYYIRRPGPQSAPPQSGREWDELIQRCLAAARGRQLDEFRLILTAVMGQTFAPEELATESERIETDFSAWIQHSDQWWQSLVAENLSADHPARLVHGYWSVAYWLLAEFERPSGGELRDTLKKIQGRETGWPPWLVVESRESKPYPRQGVLECWLGKSGSAEPGHSDFWRASPDGKMFLRRGYQEDDSPDDREPGTMFDLILPIWRIGECLLHAERLANALGVPSAEVLFRAEWTGLAGRTLMSWANPYRRLGPIKTYQCHQDLETGEVTVAADRISATLPEIVSSVTAPLYEAFDLFEAPPQMVPEELSRMTGRQYE